MNLIQFPEQTVVIGKDQPEYIPLPAWRLKHDPIGRVVCCWKLSWIERLKLLLTGILWHEVLTFNKPFQPIRLAIEKPNMPAVPPEDEHLDSLAEEARKDLHIEIAINKVYPKKS